MAEELLITKEEEDKKLIQSAYRSLLRTIKAPLDERDSRMIRQAYKLAVEAHKEQRRKSGEPYILHPIAVAQICSEEIGLGPTAIVCALLHDVVEDTDVTLDDIREQFSNKIAQIVDGLTKLDAAYNYESKQAENFKKVLSTLMDDVRVVLIKMADRLHNMRTLGAMPRNSQLKIAAETSFIYAPLAHRLGLYKIKTEYLDLCMKITERDFYDEIAQKLNETKADREAFIASFIQPLEEKINTLGIQYKIIGRPKSIQSIANKLHKKRVTFEEVYDLFAIRIIVDVPPEKEKLTCWQVYSLITDVHDPVPERLKDWVTTPKANGYESLHTTVIGPRGRFVEIQIRSTRMDEIAEKGFAAHWKYKGVAVSNQKDDIYERWLDSVREILEDPTNDAVEFLGDFKANNLFQEEVFVYTPLGDSIILPKGATALDFAFSIHTDIGYHCTAIKVNNKLVPMGKPLRNGDQVEVFTSKSQKPKEDWLNMVITGKAKSKIRSTLKEERRKIGELGKEKLERKLRHLKVDFRESIEWMVKYLELNSPIDLYYAIATEEKNIPELFRDLEVEGGKLTEKGADVPVLKEAPEPPAPARPRKKMDLKPTLLINGEPAEKYEYSLASCCNPVQGDDIFAYLGANAGLKIHRSNCPNAMNLMVNYGYRIMKAEWVVSTSSTFVAELIITGIDSGPGVIEQLMNNISTGLGLNIRALTIEGEGGYYEAKLKIMVRNTDQLSMVMRSLENLENVSTVTRVN